MAGNNGTNGLQNFTTAQFLNFALGFFGLQFGWQMRIILSGPVTESLGASPFIYGLIWLAGPFTGMIVQPLIGAMSDRTNTKFGRRRPYLLGGALLASIALWIFPNSGHVIDVIGKTIGLNFPLWAGLLFAAIMIWIIDASINIVQGPYRALVPDIVPARQFSIANSYISLAIGLGSVIAAGTAPFLRWAFNYQMSIPAQFIMAALAFSLSVIWTCVTIKESGKCTLNEEKESKRQGFCATLADFFKLSPEVVKISIMQFFTWFGVMCMMIFFTQYSVHMLFGVPDLTSVPEAFKKAYENSTLIGTNFSSICFSIFNLVCFLFAIPVGILSSKYSNKKVHIIALIIMFFAFLAMAFLHNPKLVALCMAIAGIGWASLLALPFAMLSKYIKPGTEGSVMGIFNIFIAGPQVFVCTLVAWFISKCEFHVTNGVNYHWEYSFIIGSICIAIAIIITYLIKEREEGLNG